MTKKGKLTVKNVSIICENKKGMRFRWDLASRREQ